MACVSNFGAYSNWTGHVLAGSNSYGFGRLSWSGGSLTSEEINRSENDIFAPFHRLTKNDQFTKTGSGQT